MGFLDLLQAMVDSVSCVFKTLACRKNAFKHSYTVECGNRLRVGVCSGVSKGGFLWGGENLNNWGGARTGCNN